MLTLLLFLFILLTTLFCMVGYIKLSIATLIITIVSFLLIGNGLAPALLLRYLQKPFVTIKPIMDGPTAIVLLGAGTTKTPDQQTILPLIEAYPPIYETARLYIECINSGNKCTVIISGGDALHTGKSEAAVYRDMLTSLNVNAADIILEPESMNTFQNAQFSSRLLQQHTFKQVLLVTSSLHMRRSIMAFTHFGIKAIPVCAGFATVSISLLPRARNFYLTDAAMHEYIGILEHTTYDILGWNK